MSNVIPFPTVSRAYHTALLALQEALINAAEEVHDTGMMRCASALRVHEAMRVYFEEARVELGETLSVQ